MPGNLRKRTNLTHTYTYTYSEREREREREKVADYWDRFAKNLYFGAHCRLRTISQVDKMDYAVFQTMRPKPSIGAVIKICRQFFY